MNILIADDDAVSLRVLQATLNKWSYDTMACVDGEMAWAVLQEKDAPQIAIIDWMMPGLDGLEVCRRVRRKTSGNLRLRSTSPYIYIILLTAKGRKENVIEGLEAGADDYLVKPFNPNELQVRLRAGQRIVELQSALLALQEDLYIRATNDSLTQVANRGSIMEILAHEVKRSQRDMKPCSLIMLDLDHFKQVNDTHGHQVGDEVLVEIARRLKAAVRGNDTVGRYGGEEFLITLTGCGLENAMTVAEKIRAIIADTPMSAATGPLPMTASFGVTSTQLFQQSDADALLSAADAALYRAKALGRNQVAQATR